MHSRDAFWTGDDGDLGSQALSGQSISPSSASNEMDTAHICAHAHSTLKSARLYLQLCDPGLSGCRDLCVEARGVIWQLLSQLAVVTPLVQWLHFAVGKHKLMCVPGSSSRAWAGRTAGT